MKLRKTEHYNAKHSKTVRMKQSAIINMTKQLNKHYKDKKKNTKTIGT